MEVRTLVLVPTAMELARIVEQGTLSRKGARAEVCGFGVVAAAARSAQLLSALKPKRVLLLGIAGTFEPEIAPVGSAVEFSRVAIDGIGVGEGDRFVPPDALGFPQWPDDKPIFDRLELYAPPSVDALLLTTCAASADAAQAGSRVQRFAGARAEDMEGFGVAMACALFACPLRIVRGISNQVGDRESSRWRIADALGSARQLALEIIESHD